LSYNQPFLRWLRPSWTFAGGTFPCAIMRPGGTLVNESHAMQRGFMLLRFRYRGS
jgi:hypothetical protein